MRPYFCDTFDSYQNQPTVTIHSQLLNFINALTHTQNKEIHKNALIRQY